MDSFTHTFDVILMTYLDDHTDKQLVGRHIGNDVIVLPGNLAISLG